MNEGMNGIIDPNQSVPQASNKNIFPRKIKSPSRFNKSAQMKVTPPKMMTRRERKNKFAVGNSPG